MLGGANSGQTSIKCCDQSCNVEPLSLKNWGFDHEVGSWNIFLQLHLQVQIYQLAEGLGMRKILAHGIRMQKTP